MKLFNENFPCKSPLFVPIYSNSTVSEVITSCFALIFLPSILAAFSFICLLFLLFYGFIILSPKLLITKLLITKLIFFGSIVFISLASLFLAFINEKDSESIFGASLSLIISVTSFASYLRCWHSGIPSSIWLHLIYFFNLLIIIPKFIFLINLSNLDIYELFLFEAEAVCIFALNILLCFADRFSENYENFSNLKPVDPDRTSSSLARAIFAQAGHLMSKGYKNTIDYETFWSLDPRNQPERLLTLYKKYLSKTETKPKLKIFPWLFLILLKCTWFLFSAGIILTALDAIITFSDPIFLKLIISSAENDYPLWYGFTLVIAALFVSWIKLSMMARSDFYTVLAYMDVQTILTNIVYQKMLKLSSAAKIKYSAGEAVNLVFTDVERISSFWYNLLDFVYSPIMIIVCLVALFFVIGINVFYGIAVIVAFVPINAVLVKLANDFEQREMELKDDRLKLMTDVLSGVKVLKLYAWEESMHARISKIRTQEATQRKYGIYCYSLVDITFDSCPIFATIVSFIGYIIIQGHPLTPQVAFISLMLFNLMRFSIYSIPKLFQEVINARISLNRVQDFLLESEVPDLVNTINTSDQSIVFQVKDADFSWTLDPQILPTLKSLSLEIKEGELIGIIGRVGSGKSSLLSSICGELNQISGEFFRKPSLTIAYAPQEAWIQNLSFRNNILFGKIFDEQLYQKIIDACALKEDLKQFVAGDETEIGEKGLNLSGGQKARVALARAVYQSSDLYILDDTLSAVDSHVGSHIFRNVIGNNGILKNKTRIFALNSVSYLPQCDRVIVMKEGNIVDIGTYDELQTRQNETFIELVKELATKEEEEDELIKEDDLLGELETPGRILHTPTLSEPSSPIRQRRRRTSSSTIPFFRSTSQQLPPTTNFSARLIEDEELAIGKVSSKMYFDYIKAFGIKLSIIYFFTIFILRTFFESFSQIWMAKWSAGFSSNNSQITELENLEIYGTFSILSCIVSGTSTVLVAYGSFKASQKLHDNLLFSLLRSPMTFFDTTPLGRILNRLSKDIEKVDNDVPMQLSYSATLLGECAFYLISAIYFIPQIGFLSIFVMIIFVFITRYYTYTSVQIRRLCSAASSAVASHLQDSYVGVNTIRVFSVQDRFSNQMMKREVTAIEADLGELVCNKWIELRMSFLTSIFTSILTAFAIYFGHIGYITAAAVALVTSTGTMLRNLLGSIAKAVKSMEMSIVAVERVQEYANNEYEAEWISTIPPPLNWPLNGNIIFKDFSLRYRPSTPLVLKQLNFEIKGGEKIGVVGRTGAGKTSLTMALFRMIEPSEGTILIDSIDYTSLGLHDLRKALTIIPQDPVLFCGNLRINLDPFENFTDSELWNAIGKAHLQKFVNEFPEKLEHEISEGGGNLSVGQRQLICLARAILRKKTKILILDEATASVDAETDSLIQESIRSQFSQCTILTIAHRLNTVMDYDKILVMDSGEIREYDSPKNLLSNKNGLFYSLAEQAKLV